MIGILATIIASYIAWLTYSENKVLSTVNTYKDTINVPVIVSKPIVQDSEIPSSKTISNNQTTTFENSEQKIETQKSDPIVVNTDFSKYSKSESIPPCETNNTGDIVFRNQSNRSFFVYYDAHLGNMAPARMLYVPANDFVTVSSIKINEHDGGVFIYKVTLEKVNGGPNLNEISDYEITSGNFTVIKCVSNTIDIKI